MTVKKIKREPLQRVVEQEKFTQAELEEAFPNISPQHKPYGSRLLVQLRSAKTKTKSGIILTSDAQDTEKWNTQIAKVRAIGPVAFKNRTTLEAWPEKEWCEVGTFVRIPKWNQDKWEIEHAGSSVLFMLVNDIDILAEVEGDPLSVKAFI